MPTSSYQLVCGMEVHAELNTKSKMFCACKNDPFAAQQPNIYTCPVCLGMPGALPVANRLAIEWTIKIGLALHCQINLFSKFDRKNYFYPDLAKGYQISQYDIPFCHDGYLDTSEGRVRIHRIHLEEDTAKLIHQNGQTLIDFNRSGVPLVEIVTEADIKTPSQAKEYGQKLRQILRYLEVAHCDMEQGGMRLEANISLKAKDAPADLLPDYKVECKNINSFKFVEAAIAYEMDRQAKLLDQGLTPKQETRGYNAKTGQTFSQRSKEDAEDYRYFPDPDLPPLEFTQADINQIRESLPELPAAKAERFVTQFNLKAPTAHRLVSSRNKADFFEKMLNLAKKRDINPQKIANALLNKRITYQLDEAATDIIDRYLDSQQVNDLDQSEINQAIQSVVTANADAVTKYQAGKHQVLAFLLGQVLRQLGKKVDVELVKDALLAELN